MQVCLWHALLCWISWPLHIMYRHSLAGRETEILTSWIFVDPISTAKWCRAKVQCTFTIMKFPVLQCHLKKNGLIAIYHYHKLDHSKVWQQNNLWSFLFAANFMTYTYCLCTWYILLIYCIAFLCVVWFMCMLLISQHAVICPRVLGLILAVPQRQKTVSLALALIPSPWLCPGDNNPMPERKL